MSQEDLLKILSEAGLKQVDLVRTALDQIITGFDFSGELPSHSEYEKDFFKSLEYICNYCNIGGKIFSFNISGIKNSPYVSFMFGEGVYETFRFTLDDHGENTLMSKIESLVDGMFDGGVEMSPIVFINDKVKDKAVGIGYGHYSSFCGNYKKLFLATIYALFDEKTRTNIGLDLCTIIAACSSFMVFGVDDINYKIYCIKR